MWVIGKSVSLLTSRQMNACLPQVYLLSIPFPLALAPTPLLCVAKGGDEH